MKRAPRATIVHLYHPDTVSGCAAGRSYQDNKLARCYLTPRVLLERIRSRIRSNNSWWSCILCWNHPLPPSSAAGRGIDLSCAFENSWWHAKHKVVMYVLNYEIIVLLNFGQVFFVLPNTCFLGAQTLWSLLVNYWCFVDSVKAIIVQMKRDEIWWTGYMLNLQE